MKRKIFSILFFVVLMVSLGLVTAVPVVASPATLEVNGPAKLTTDAGHYLGSFSPDGSKIVCTGAGGIWVMNADGSNPQTVYASGTRPKWGPPIGGYPGGLIALAGTGITIIQPDGTLVKTIDVTHSYPPDPARTETQTHSLDWSPDGTKIAFATASWTSAIWTVNFDGTGLTQITDYSQTAYSPAWSPDGTEIACAWGPSANMFVGVFKADGTGLARTVGIGGSYGGDYPDWGANGKIAYHDSIKALHVMNGDGTGDTVMFAGPVVMVAWSPDGKRIVYLDGFGGNVWTRGYPCATIQAAIDAAGDGDTINVAAGTYNEQVVIDKQLTLNGANADVNAVTGTRGSESIIYGETSTAITISADDVIVDGFTLDGGITLDDQVNPISGGTISNNIITGADNPVTKAQNGIRVGFDNNGKGVDGITIENNTIINSLCKGIRFSNTKLDFNDPHDPQRISNITISGNEIKDNGSAGMETYGPGPNTIINNIISGNAGNGINLKFDDGDVVTGNTITNNTGPGITLRQVTNTVVENNSMSGHVSEEVINTCDTVPGGKGSGIHIFDASENNTIRFNDISGNNYGIFIHSKDSEQPSSNSIIYNNIAGNINYGILNALVDPPAPVDATNNWWGTKAKGLIKTMVSDNVVYIPWLDAAYPGGKPQSYNVRNMTTLDEYDCIQEAIDAASDFDTINVAAGTYNENLLIDKALTLTGTDGATETIIDGTSTYIVNIVHSDVTFEGFTVTNPENEGGGDISGILIGGWNYTPIPENVKILNNIVKQVRSETGTPSTFATTGINVGASKNVVISGNTITDIQNPGPPVGSSADDHTCGINVWGDTLTGSSRNIAISNNIISDIKYNGIILEGAIDVQIGENDITGCESGVRVKPREGEISNVQIGENDITGCEYGISVVPEAFTLSGLTINLNNFADNSIQVFDDAEALDIQGVLDTNTFDRAVVVDHASLLHTIWSSIQDGIDAAVSGDTINVAAGNYDEEIKIMDKSLTLLGAQADVPIVNGERAGDESIIRGKGTGSFGTYSWCVIRIQHSNVIVNGFTIENGQRAIAIQGSSIRREGISNILVSYNYIEKSGKDGIFRDNAAADVAITHNYIASNPRGIATNGGATTITDNTFYGNGKCIDFHGGDPYSVYFPDYAEPKYPTIISGNTFTDDSTSITLRLDKCHQSITITGNDITEARSAAIKTWNTYDVDLVNPAIHYNNIRNNEFGIDNQVAGINLDATNNWWGDATGSKQATTNPCATGDGVSDNVDYTPWLDAAYPDGSERSYNVRNMTTLDEYRYIQAAIDAASDNNTINVLKGTYTEAILIEKQLILKGESGAVIKPDNATPTYDGARRVAVKVQQVDGVTIDGFEIDGTGGTVHYGIYPFNSNNTVVKNNVIHDITNEIGAPGSDVAGVGIIVFGWERGISGILIEGNTVYNTGRMGIGVTAWGPSGWFVCSDTVITNNTVHDAWQGPTDDHGGGIQINVAKNCSITNNEVYNVQNGQRGIYMFGSAAGNTITSNTLRDNPIGIELWISGEDGDPIDWEDGTPASPQVHFNNIYGNTDGAISTNLEGTTTMMVIDATNNWWGTKAKGLIKNMVSDNVDYDPWIGAGAKDSKSKKTAEDDDTVDAKDKTDTTVLKKGKGKPTITITEYEDNPGDGAPGGFSSVGKYIDVHLDNTTDVEEIEIRNYYTLADIVGLDEATLKLSWWNGTAWIECSDSGATYPVGEPYRGYVWAKIRADTIPTLDDMAGTAFMSMGSPPPPPAPVGDGGGGGGGPAPTPAPGTTDIRGMASTAGRFWYSVTAISEDELCTLTIPKGTVGLTEELKPLTEITMLIMDEPPSPPEDAHVVGLAYDFQPSGATFDPAITLTWSYEPADIPEGIDEEDLVLAYYDEAAGEWVELEGCVVDTENDTITASVSHFTTFAIVGAAPPLPPAPAAFSVTDLSIQPAEVEPKEAVTIIASVANTSEVEGSYSVVLKINDVKEAEKSVTVAAGASEDVSFSVTREEVASYSVTVDGLSSSFTVVTPPLPVPVPAPAPLPVKPINWPLIGGIIGGVVVAGLLVFFLVRRKWLA